MVAKRRGSQMRNFYLVLAAIAVAGGGVIAWQAMRPSTQGTAVLTPVTAAQAEGHLLGNPSAPVEILEFADFQCPACGHFATITEPDVRKRIVEAGLASFRFFDYPLPQHRNAIPAHLAAGCAAEQGKFWEMHDKLFEMQGEWSSARSPKGEFEDYARQVGLDVATWESCYDAQRPMSRIRANAAEGDRRGVRSTPTFVIGNRMIASAIPYDVLKAHVDTAFAAKAADSAAATTASAPGEKTAQP
ncbi:MAG TPA: thioredoxin domain-containing protein [Gemmatimonadaceae bacterium]|nr:thioredoxin domain-containing protein [Gemmatimonadaceae bacterium]